ncbi:MAG: 3-dehydroquinate synthase [Saprospiraceae bacterium]
MTMIAMQDYHLHLGEASEALNSFIKPHHFSQIVLLVDRNTERDCLPLLHLNHPSIISIPAGEAYKTIATCEIIWKKMLQMTLDRNCLMINLGGGVIGDMGGFCAATYKRGIAFIQMPTTLLSMVDASIGGKLAVDLGAVKNSIGVFQNPKAVIIDPHFLKTLSLREIRSGFAEIIKHSLIWSPTQWEELQMIKELSTVDWMQWLEKSIEVKKEVVLADPFEKGIRKALNFGHTIGHAVESYFLETDHPLLHGEAIAIGMIAESYLSMRLTNLSKTDLEVITRFILNHYGHCYLPEKSFEYLLKMMSNDKKNQGNTINFTLIITPGQCTINQIASDELIIESLRFYNQLEGK